MEDYVEQFQYNLQRFKHNNLGKEELKPMIIKWMRDEYVDIVNMLGKGDISYLSKSYSKDMTKVGKIL